MGARSTGHQLDDVSVAIIEQLQEDGRRSYAAIGKVVGLSEAAVRQRVQRLLESGVMQIVAAVTDPLKLGFARAAMLGIRVSGPTAPVADALVEMDEVIYVVVTAGSIDIVAEVIAKSDADLLTVSDQIRRIPGVQSTESFVYLETRKEVYNWGLPRPGDRIPR
ncbi:AsnC family transcriptional regulator [Nocardioides silvaticus]|uniref:AsnC family transcriptional regulator n=1 Tax=Nocardioides silvaticus TaxID=2201891 RepID=A0A316TJ65_9ACTN|nr:Lrp/AsnC family transcriptional regulator [Nocardioides silvaticus]PWN03269.1 AsnC family transcriptional regulator [Nocardioides silvaticus]